jgi:hypothetical protein
MDALKELRTGARDLEDIEQIYDAIMDSDEASHVAGKLGLSQEEWTAFSHGVWFDELAKWRYEGWPRRCIKCGAELNISAYGWTTLEREEGQHVLTHLRCPAPSDE